MPKHCHSRSLVVVSLLSLAMLGCGGDDATRSADTATSKDAKHARRPADPPAKTITNSIGMKFTRIPAGEFLMGSPT